MSATKPPTTPDSLRRAIADGQAKVAALQAKLAKHEAAATGAPTPITGLDMLWEAALPMSRQRSSKHRCRQAWQRLPKSARPTMEVMLHALKCWNRSDQWYASFNLYAPGLHRFISERMWESLPEKSAPAPLHRGMSAKAPLPISDGPGITDPAEISRLLGMTPKPISRPRGHVNGPEQITAMLAMVAANRPLH